MGGKVGKEDGGDGEELRWRLGVSGFQKMEFVF